MQSKIVVLQCLSSSNFESIRLSYSFFSKLRDGNSTSTPRTRAFVLPLIYIGKLKTRKRNKPKNSKCILAKFYKLRIIYIHKYSKVCLWVYNHWSRPWGVFQYDYARRFAPSLVSSNKLYFDRRNQIFTGGFEFFTGEIHFSTGQNIFSQVFQTIICPLVQHGSTTLIFYSAQSFNTLGLLL